MEVFDRGDLLRKSLGGARAAGGTVGLVPTMGFLHRGHRALIERSVTECDLTAVTVFVNPLQFGPAEDYEQYPRDLARDVEVAERAGADVVFAPPVADMYPDGPPAASVHVGGPLARGMEADSRPGHFDGVATVVAKLWNLAGPCRAYFGEKDFQQLEVVRRLAVDLCFPVEVVGCATVREPDGLACSSRNARLTPAGRRAATVLYRALDRAAAAVSAGERDLTVVRAMLAATVAQEPLATLGYAEVLGSPGGIRLFVAAGVGGVRLIDNLHVPTSRGVPCAAG
jgi:pantoate--beta-alanine ligase